jgi:PadR family transcriptional regulator PadR
LTDTLPGGIVYPVTDLSFDNWMTQLRKGLLELAILNTIAPAPLYGYDIVRRLSDVDHLVITEGTVYPILSRLKNSGLVETYIEESQEGPARKYYRLTARGRDDLHRMNQHWDSLHHAIGGLRKEQKR